jgi:hypothetical protein
MAINEQSLKADLMQALASHMRGSVSFRHEDLFRLGIPDISHTWRMRTVWLEAKHAKPQLRGRKQQTLTMCHLAAAGVAWYVIWQEPKPDSPGARQWTLIVEPRCVMNNSWREVQVARAPGFDHDFVADFLRRAIDGTW